MNICDVPYEENIVYGENICVSMEMDAVDSRNLPNAQR